MTAPRLLIVDDEPANRELLLSILEPEGFQCLEAEDGVKAVEVVRGGGIDLVLLDVLMPRMNGIDACRVMRHELRAVTLPIVLVTALSDRSARIRGKDAGADDFLLKPVDELELLARVRTLLQAKAFHDLRDQQHQYLERELEATRAQLLHVDRLATLGTLAAGVGHELKNITAVLVAGLREARRLAGSGEALDEELLEQLERASAHLGEHACHLLGRGRPAVGSSEAEMDLCIAEVVQGTVAMLTTAGRLKYVEVVVSELSESLRVAVARTHLEQILINLLCNAADALLEVTQRRRQIAIQLDRHGSVVRLVVADTGPGIAPESLDAIFEPYFTTKPTDRGTGLGLTVVRQLVELYQGRVTVESEVGAGTRFVIELPAAAPSRLATSAVLG
jgi:C4-dicarboxylate-specific signal transduction histidine kinase